MITIVRLGAEMAGYQFERQWTEPSLSDTSLHTWVRDVQTILNGLAAQGAFSMFALAQTHTATILELEDVVISRDDHIYIVHQFACVEAPLPKMLS